MNATFTLVIKLLVKATVAFTPLIWKENQNVKNLKLKLGNQLKLATREVKLSQFAY